MTHIQLPNNFTPRQYQDELMAYMDAGGDRACAVWHRRAGKDAVSIHQIAKMAHQRRGLYWHMLPTQRQARKVVWDAFTKSGDRLIDQAFPAPLRKGEPNNTEMKIPLRCGSLYQLVGSDNYNSLVGSNPIGVVFSEWSLTDPRIWDYIRPILLENDGWAIFIYTPRGYNHGWDIKNIAEASKDWFYSHKTVDDTQVLSSEDIQKELRDGMPEELVQQEFYCSFSAANVGAILGSRLEAAEKEGRIVDEDLYDPAGAPVIASCDIGFRDTTAFWFWQVKKDGVALVHYMEDSGLEAQDWISEIEKLKQFNLGTIYLPHDAKAKTFATRNSALEQFLKSGFEIKVLPSVKIPDRINAARAIMQHCRFQKTACAHGLAALREWTYQWDDRRKVFSKDPLHNWASHGSDGFSYGALVMSDRIRGWNDSLAKIREDMKPSDGSGASYVFTLEQLHNMNANNRRQRL